MGQLAFAAVGAVISTAAGAGPAIGWAVGSAIGGVVFAPDGPQTTGPRLTDLQSNVSTYGQPIARCYGQIGFMGSLIWMDDIKEYENVEEQGKGGDPASNTTFTYSDSFAMILCRGEVSTIPESVAVQALNRIWINEKCFYDVRDETNIEAMVASANFARYFTFYPGTQTQEPDPTMESVLGVGNVPAYRGRAYIVFTDLPLGLVQNQPPGALRIVFEVTMTGTPVTGLRILKEGVPPLLGYGANQLLMPVTEGLIRIIQSPPDSFVSVSNVNGEPLTIDVQTEEEEEWPTGGTSGYLDNSVAVTRLIDGSAVRMQGITNLYAVNDPLQVLYTELADNGGTVDALPLILPQTDIIYGVVPSADQQHLFVFTGDGSMTDNYHLLQWDVANQEWLLIRKAAVITASGVQQASGPSSQVSPYYAGMAETDLRHIWFITSAGIPGFYLTYIADDFTLAAATPDSFVDDADMIINQFDPVQIWADRGLAYGIIGDRYYVATRNDGAAVNNQTLEEVHEAECFLAGLTQPQVDASELASITVDGMFVRRLGATRGVIATLEPSYFYDTVESAGILKAVLRGNSSIVTIDDAEMGASISDQAEDDLINPERAEEDTLPGEVIVTYIDRASDYQVAAQHDRRSAVETDQPVNLEMPLVFTPTVARQIAGVWMYNQWISRTRRTVRLSRKYSYLEPTDVITLRTDVADFVVRIVAIKTNDGFIEAECVDEDAALYSQNAEGAPVEQGTEITLPTPSKLVLLDIPMLRESDNDPGFYIAAAGFSSSWPGAAILRSTDGGISYSTVASMATAATIGNVLLPLGNWTGVMGYDSANSISVTLFGGQTLQSVTDAELLGGANAFALGSTTTGYELAQFKTATLVGGNTWLLTQLLRGRRGTEHEMSGHGANETFVMLESDKMRRIAIDEPAIGIENHYKAVTFGQLPALASRQSFTNTAAGLKPYSPVNGHATGFGGDIDITWTRRGRLYNDWRDGVELPLGEASEAYVVEIWNALNTSVVRTISGITSPTTTYSSANQITDFGSNPSSLNVRIFQISAIVGRGFPLIVTLS